LAVEAGFGLAGCGSESFGVSAKAVPQTRNSDSVSAANLFIASLFSLKISSMPNFFAYHPAWKVNGPSYSYMNQM
jgi:hypothetical protein